MNTILKLPLHQSKCPSSILVSSLTYCTIQSPASFYPSTSPIASLSPLPLYPSPLPLERAILLRLPSSGDEEPELSLPDLSPNSNSDSEIGRLPLLLLRTLPITSSISPSPCRFPLTTPLRLPSGDGAGEIGKGGGGVGAGGGIWEERREAGPE